MAAKTTTSPGKGGAKIHQRFMSTPSFLKTKFLSVLGSSNELIHELSNRLDMAQSQSSVATTPEGPRDPRLSVVCGNDDDDESIDENFIDFESRKVKEQRAREELKSGCYRQPSFIKHVRCADEATVSIKQPPEETSSQTKPASSAVQANAGIVSTALGHLLRVETCGQAHALSPSSSPSSVANVEPRVLPPPGDEGSTTVTSPMREVFFRGGFTAQSFDVTSMSSREATAEDSRTGGGGGGGGGEQVASKMADNASTATSENDQSDSDSSDPNRCMRTVSQNSLPSPHSSLSLDSRTDETQPALVFMRDFVNVLFTDCSAITLDLKAAFGATARTETGRVTFARLVSAKRSACKKVNEPTFYSLIQYFAIVLFECCDSEDYSPAKILMNMCFTFYHEVEVPGCEPYREYLYTYLREQPIWQSLRFWNAAIFDALQCERVRSILPTVPIPPANQRNKKASVSDDDDDDEDDEDDDNDNTLGYPDADDDDGAEADDNAASRQRVDDNDDNDTSSSGHGHSGVAASRRTLTRRHHEQLRSASVVDRRQDEAQMHQNISFGQLGTFTCNMHAFGLPRELCTEFLRKQCVIANLNREQERTLLENVHRMYNETAKWRE